MRKTIFLLMLLSAVLLGSGCSSAVYFRSNPSGAKLTINGIPRGTTPCSVQLKWTTFTTFDVRLEKEDCKQYVTKLELEPKWLYIVLDSLLCWPLLLVNSFGPKEVYHFDLTPLSEGPPKEPGPGETPPDTPPAKPGDVQVYKDVKDRPRMACLEFRAGNKQAQEYTTTLQEMFCTGFAKSRRFSVIEREQIEKILKEKQFVQTGAVDAKTARQLGNILGVGYLLIGSVSRLNETFEIDARIVDVETGEIKNASRDSCTSESQLWSTVCGILNELNRKFSE